MPSEEKFISRKNTQLIKEDDTFTPDLNEEEQDPSNRKKTIAIYIGLALLCIIMIVLPIVLLNFAGVGTASTTTTGKSLNDKFR